MAKSVNTKIHDAVAMRIVEVTRAANGEAAEIVRGIMADADDRILARLAVIDDPSRMTPKQIALLEEKIKNALSAQERKMRRRLKGYVNEVSAIELEAMVELMDRVLDPTGVKTRTPTANAAAAKARREPIGGVKMSQSIRRFFEADRRRVIDTLRSGITAGATTQQIARSIVGSPGRRNLDGVRQVSRRGLATMIQTISTHAGGQGREAFAAANTDIITEERWVSTLDADTCPVCGALDGRIFPVGQGPQPPAHPNCRCARMPIIPGLRALKVKDKGILPATVRDSFDGKSPKVLTYPEWLKGQSVTLQKDVLGPTRFALWRTGEIQLKGFVNDRGTTRTLKELRSRIPKVFEMAGIDPKKKF